MQTKGQSAIEFLSTYSFTFLIIAIVLFVLLLFASLPKATLPLECVFYSNFNCVDIAYYNLASGSQLVVRATDTQPGTVNISSFNATVDYVQSTSGYCIPNLTTAGQTVYCIANFSSSERVGNLYVGNFKIIGEYCAKFPNAAAYLNCSGSPAVTFGGTFQTEGGTVAPQIFISYRISQLQSAQGTALTVDGSSFEYNQLPLVRSYMHGTTHALLYSPMITNAGASAYIFNSVSGCGVTAEGAILSATESCTVTATYNSISYGSCPSIPNKGGTNLKGITAQYCDLVGYDLTGDNIQGGNLYGSDMQNANLNGANLNGANLAFANLQNALMQGVNFNNADLQGANMQGSNAISGSNFAAANLQYADMQGSNAKGANFNGANLQFASMQNADLAGSNLGNANLAYANLSGADTTGANFNGANTLDCTGCPSS